MPNPTTQPTGGDEEIAKRIYQLAYSTEPISGHELLEAKELIVSGLSSRDLVVKRWATYLIGKMGADGSDQVDHLIAQLHKPLPHDPTERLQELLENAGLEVAARAATNPSYKLAFIPEEEWSQFKKARYLRYQTLSTLVSVAPGSERVADEIAGLATDDDRETRLHVAYALKEAVATPRSTAALRALSTNSDAEIAAAANEALQANRKRGR